MGARFMPNEGLIGGGRGQRRTSRSRSRSRSSGLVNNLLTTVTSLLGASSGAAFRDNGTLIDRVYDRTGIRLLGLLDLGALFENAANLEPGVLNLLGTSNPLGSTAANYLVWGNVAGWSSSYYVVWGNTIQAPSGQYLVWGNNERTDSNYVVWGNADTPTPATSCGATACPAAGTETGRGVRTRLRPALPLAARLFVAAVSVCGVAVVAYSVVRPAARRRSRRVGAVRGPHDRAAACSR